LPNGDINPELPHGLFVRDTRILSRWSLMINGQPVEPLTAETKEPFRALFAGRVPRTDGYADSPLIVERLREVGAGILEQITVSNFSLNPVECVIQLRVEADFADLFEVKEARIQRYWVPTRHPKGDSLLIRAVWENARKGVAITAHGADIQEETLTYRAILGPQAYWTTTLTAVPDEQNMATDFSHPTAGGLSPSDLRRQEWVDKIPVPQVENTSIERTVKRSYDDLGALRIEDPEHPERIVVAAGAPWFMTLFGRDSLWASEMALPVDASLALGTLQTLAERQGKVVDPLSEEEPGKILHEVRLGVSSGLSLGGKPTYYGSVDATPLFVSVLGSVSRWGFPAETIAALLPHADRALAWIQDYGDKDGDGFVEYQRLNERGLINQGWKDSWDGINFADGTLAVPPIALCEVQAYVYDAYIARAWMAADAGQTSLATELSERAKRLKKQFNEQFWLPERGYYAVALDGKKRPVDACTSNMGQCLWSGIVDEDKAPLVAERLMSPEMFSGWGIRTLASDMGAYNPVSYHNGSVWPHDNAIIAAGLIRYGFTAEAQQITMAIMDAAEHSNGRLPELFCGFPRERYSRPVPYPTACSPQAWAAATPLMLWRSLMRYDVHVSRGRVWMDPALPETVGDVHISNVPLGDARLTIDISRTATSISGLPEGVTFHRGHRPWNADLLEHARALSDEKAK
jgi:glycogen debranching enzyme